MLELLSATLKALGYAAALTGAGTVLARTTLGGASEVHPTWPTGLVRWCGLALALVTCCTAILFVERLGGDGDPVAVRAVLRSPLGLALGLHLAGATVLAIAPRHQVSLLGAALVLISFGIVGHSASAGYPASLAVTLHVAAAAWWVGGLWILLLENRSASADAYALLVRRFSSQAVWMVAGLICAALTTAALILDLNLDPGRDYDRGLLAKAGIAVTLLGLAGVNKLVLSPKLAASPWARSRLRGVVLSELLLVGLILGVTSWLTTYASPHEVPPSNGRPENLPQSAGPIAIIDPWAPEMPGGIGAGAGYMTIVNNRPIDDNLIAAASPWAEHVSLHASITENDIARMRKLAGLRIPARGRVTLEPGVYHLMFTGLYAPFVAGDVVPLTLTFANAGTVRVTLHVQALGSRPADEHRH